ncbi:MAG: class I SAM-dependent methyltransferase [Lachnospiraceae bacterium]|nr:class I SAM-dependent methyltransferase [Lachnospiraceae bacterium]
MEAYSAFADVYDEFMDETPYELWRDRIVERINKYGISKPHRFEGDMDSAGEEEILESEKNLVLDLGCGTGTLTELLYDEGYDMIGVDNSFEMLTKAFVKKEEKGSDILYLSQDMRDLDLYSTIGTVISVCDSVNYITKPEELLGVFKSIENYLFPGGIFIFDFNTLHKYKDVIGDSTIAEDRDDCSFIWDNYFDEETEINEYDLTLFVKEEDNLYRKFTETHYQRGYTLKEIKEMLEKAGLKVLEAMDLDTEAEADEESERIMIVAKKEV